LPLVVLRDEVQVRLRHLDVEPEDPVVADLETLDSRALLLRRLHRRDGGATPLRQIRQIVEVRPKAGTHETGLATRGHLVDQRAPRLPPAAVSVRSTTDSSVPPRRPSGPWNNSRFCAAVGSIQRWRAGCSTATRTTCFAAERCVSCRYANASAAASMQSASLR